MKADAINEFGLLCPRTDNGQGIVSICRKCDQCGTVDIRCRSFFADSSRRSNIRSMWTEWNAVLESVKSRMVSNIYPLAKEGATCEITAKYSLALFTPYFWEHDAPPASMKISVKRNMSCILYRLFFPPTIWTKLDEVGKKLTQPTPDVAKIITVAILTWFSWPQSLPFSPPCPIFSRWHRKVALSNSDISMGLKR